MIRIRQNLTKTWQSQIEAATTQITVLTPYITPNDTLPLLKKKMRGSIPFSRSGTSYLVRLTSNSSPRW